MRQEASCSVQKASGVKLKNGKMDEKKNGKGKNYPG